MPLDWPAVDGDLHKALGEWLALEGDVGWVQQAWVNIEDCRPPLHGISAHTRGIAFLRWMLQRILPYPTALIDVAQLAARLRVTPRSLSRALSESKDLRELLDPVAYVGRLEDFMGPHWWRAGVNAVLFDLAEPGDLEALQKKVLATSTLLEPVAPAQPVVVLGADLRAADDLVAIEDAVRVQPDDWPPFASSAWMAIEAVKGDQKLASLVVEDDRARLFSKVEKP